MTKTFEEFAYDYAVHHGEFKTPCWVKHTYDKLRLYTIAEKKYSTELNYLNWVLGLNAEVPDIYQEDAQKHLDKALCDYLDCKVDDSFSWMPNKYLVEEVIESMELNGVVW